jgi:lysozyme
MMQVSDAGRRFIESWEGFSASAYLCPAGIWTIGYGHTEGVRPGQRISRSEASAMLAKDLVCFGSEVSRLLGGSRTEQQEFDAMTSLAFNIGIGGFARSTVLRHHRRGDKQAAARAFALWNMAVIGGVKQAVPGLTRRRAAETSMYLTPDQVTNRIQPFMASGHLPEQVTPEEIPQAIAPPKENILASKTAIGVGIGGVSTAASLADQLGNLSYATSSAGSIGLSVASIIKTFGPIVLGVIALGALGYVGWRYWWKIKAGDVVSR